MMSEQNFNEERDYEDRDMITSLALRMTALLPKDGGQGKQVLALITDLYAVVVEHHTRH